MNPLYPGRQDSASVCKRMGQVQGSDRSLDLLMLCQRSLKEHEGSTTDQKLRHYKFQKSAHAANMHASSSASFRSSLGMLGPNSIPTYEPHPARNTTPDN